MTLPLNAIGSLLLNARRIAVVTHTSPDGDAIGSAVALTHVLADLGKDVVAVCADEVPATFQFLTGGITFQKDLPADKADLVVAVDCGDLRRTGFRNTLIGWVHSGGTLVHIDHHPKSDLSKLSTHAILNSAASSTAEVLWDVIQALPAKHLNKEITTALLCGLYTDTGGFRHQNTTPAVLRLGAALLSHGARLKWIREHVALHKSVPALRLWGIAFERIHRNFLAVVSSVITLKDLQTTGSSDADVAGIVNMLSTIPDTRLAMLVCEQEHNILKASIRTEDERVDVGAIAGFFGGGGHKRAAGFQIPGRIVLKNDGWRLELPTGSPYTNNALIRSAVN